MRRLITYNVVIALTLFFSSAMAQRNVSLDSSLYKSEGIVRRIIDSLQIIEKFNSKGVKVSEFSLINGKRCGVAKSWKENGQLLGIHNYSNGCLVGLGYTFHENGLISSKSFYDTIVCPLPKLVPYLDTLNNSCIAKYENEAIIVPHLYNLPYRFEGFDENGLIQKKSFYVNNKKHGRWEYYLEGKLACTRLYSEGKLQR